MDDLLASDRVGLEGVIARAEHGLTDRQLLVQTLVLAAVAGEHVLVVGPPGTAKSQAVRRVAQELGGSYFEYLLGRFTEPNEVFGPVDLQRLREGVVEIETAGMLPEAEVAFLDEVFLGSTAILNTLLGILNERTFRRGATVQSCPLRLCVAATNGLPDDVSLAAFADRFLIRIFVEPVADPSLEELLEAGWNTNDVSAPTPQPLGIDAVDRMTAARQACDLTSVRPLIGSAVRRMRAAGIPISDRRAVRAQNLIAAAAVMDGRTSATDEDLWPLPSVVPTAEGQPVAREVLGDLLAQSRSSTLATAAEVLSAAPAARAERLVAMAADLGAAEDVADLDRRLRVEAVLREIDAGFAPDAMPAELAEVRSRLVAELAAET